MDLDAYFDRIGYAGPRAPTLAVLGEIHRRHAHSIPFENLDVLLGRGISLEPAAIERKLVHERRGGYCFEHNALFAAVLRALGFELTTHLARVRWQLPPGVQLPLTHMILRVEGEGRPWLADAGFGGMGLATPIALDTEAEQGTPPELRRLVRLGSQTLQQARLGGDWTDVYEFSLVEAYPADFEMANWFTSTHPASRFRQNLIVALAGPDRRLSILNREFTTRHLNGPTEKRQIASADELLTVLATQFGLHFPPGTRFGLPQTLWPEP